MTTTPATDPEPPVNVRIVRAGGDVDQLELEYAGTTPDGLHQWDTTTKIALDHGDTIAADTVPARTTIRLHLAGPDGNE